MDDDELTTQEGVHEIQIDAENDDLLDESLINDQADLNLGIEGYENFDGMILGENEEAHEAEQLEKFDDLMMKRMVQDDFSDFDEQNGLKPQALDQPQAMG